MNERIKLLAEQTMNSDTAPHLSEELYCFTKSEFEKFAELIVRECARVSERTGALNEADYEGEMIADAIKEHFGVNK